MIGMMFVVAALLCACYGLSVEMNSKLVTSYGESFTHWSTLVPLGNQQLLLIGGQDSTNQNVLWLQANVSGSLSVKSQKDTSFQSVFNLNSPSSPLPLSSAQPYVASTFEGSGFGLWSNTSSFSWGYSGAQLANCRQLAVDSQRMGYWMGCIGAQTQLQFVPFLDLEHPKTVTQNLFASSNWTLSGGFGRCALAKTGLLVGNVLFIHANRVWPQRGSAIFAFDVEQGRMLPQRFNVRRCDFFSLFLPFFAKVPVNQTCDQDPTTSVSYPVEFDFISGTQLLVLATCVQRSTAKNFTVLDGATLRVVNSQIITLQTNVPLSSNGFAWRQTNSPGRFLCWSILDYNIILFAVSVHDNGKNLTVSAPFNLYSEPFVMQQGLSLFSMPVFPTSVVVSFGEWTALFTITDSRT